MRTTIFSILMAVAMGFVGMTSVQADDKLIWNEQTPEQMLQNLDTLLDADATIFGFGDAIVDESETVVAVMGCETDEGLPGPCEDMDNVGIDEVQVASIE